MPDAELRRLRVKQGWAELSAQLADDDGHPYVDLALTYSMGLNAKQCRRIGEWFLKAAQRLEDKR